MVSENIDKYVHIKMFLNISFYTFKIKHCYICATIENVHGSNCLRFKDVVTVVCVRLHGSMEPVQTSSIFFYKSQ